MLIILLQEVNMGISYQTRQPYLKRCFGYKCFSTFLTNVTFRLTRIPVPLRDPIVVGVTGNQYFWFVVNNVPVAFR